MPSKMPRGKNQTALVMIRDGAQRTALRHLLRQQGFARVLEAETGRDAIALAREELVHLVVTAWEMPDLSGVKLIQAFRDRRRGRKVPIVLVDDGLPPALVVKAVKAGIAGRLTWPFKSERMRAILSEIQMPGDPVPQAGSMRGASSL